MAEQSGDGNEVATGYGLPDIFEALRNDLLAAQERLQSSSSEPIMDLGETEVELAFTVEHAGKGKAGVNLKVFGVGFEAEGEKGITRSSVHRLKVTLTPSEVMGVAGGDDGEADDEHAQGPRSNQ